MNWISGLQNALDYVEENLTEKIDYEIVAKKAFSSSFHFQRVFSILCGYTLGDYIRMRRLSLAAEDIITSNERIIDVALKYGYDTPESFTRAFTRFHGISPSQAKSCGKVKAFSRLSVKLILSGGSTMDYRIERMAGFKVVCKRKEIDKPANALATGDITDFWSECHKDGTTEGIISLYSQNARLKGLLGICFTSEKDGSKFPYGIGVEYDGREINDDSLEIIDIPATTFAVFTCKGKMPDAFVETYKKIVSEFFPQNTKYEYSCQYEFEVYPSADVDNPDYQCEIWVSVKEK